MKKLPIPIICFLFALLFLYSCNKDETNSPDSIVNEKLLYTEEAFPNSNGDTVSVDFNGQMITCELVHGLYVYQGDILIKPDNNNTKGAGIKASSKRWPYGVVYYEINGNFRKRERINDAIAHWESKTDIVFTERTNEDDDYIEFIWDTSGCSSYVGMVGGKQEIRIADWGNAGSVIHEIGHAIGLVHEHSKKNRNDYVIIKWDNIIPDEKHNFYIDTGSLITEGFDFLSIMLYSPKAFQIDNTKPTITKLDGSLYNVQRNVLSEKDIEIVGLMYSDLHDPVYEFMFDDMQGNAHIASDGTYLYSVADGRGRINKFDLKGNWLQSYKMPLIEGRGFSYNRSDGKFYASIHGGHIIRITDMENGIIDTIYHGFMQNIDASFALSDDGEKLYDFYNGTANVYDFKTGELLDIIPDLKCDSGEVDYHGMAAIAVDVSYMYTWEAWKRLVYVYNHKGVFQRTLQLDRGKVGMSLSVIDGYLYVADDPTYDPGYWNVYNIRNPIKEK